MGEAGIKTESVSQSEAKVGPVEIEKKKVDKKESRQIGLELRKNLDREVKVKKEQVERAVMLFKGAGEESEEFDSRGEVLDQLGFYRQSKEKVGERKKEIESEVREKKKKAKELQGKLAEKETQIEESWWFVKKNKLREQRDRISTQLEKEKWDKDRAVEEREEAEKVSQAAESESKGLFKEAVRESAEELVEEYEGLAEELLNQEGLVEEWSEKLIETEVRPKVEEAVASGEVRPEQAEEFISLVKESTKKPKTQEERKREIEVRNRLDELRKETNYSLGDAYDYVRTTSWRGEGNVEGFERGVELLAKNEASEKLSEMKSSLEMIDDEKLRKESLAIIDRLLIPEEKKGSGSGLGSKEKTTGLEISLMDKGVVEREFLTREATKRWDVLGESDVFEESDLKEVEEKIAKKTVEDLAVTNEKTELSMALGNRLFWLAERNPDLKVELAPVIVMNSFREIGISNDHPFLGYGSAKENRPIYRFITSLSEEEREATGIKRMTDLIEENIENFDRRWIDKEEYARLREEYKKEKGIELDSALGGFNRELIERRAMELAERIGVDPKMVVDSDRRKKENPAYYQVQEELLETALEQVGQGDESKDFFALGILKSVGVELGEEGYEKLVGVFKESGSERVKSKALQVALYRFDDPKLVLHFVDSYREMDERAKGMLKEVGDEMLGRLVKYGDELTVEQKEVFGEMLGVSGEMVDNSLKLIEAGVESWGMSVHVDTWIEELPVMVELANKEGMLDFIDQLMEYGYRFDVGDDEVLLEVLGRREKFLADMETIREKFPEFEYQTYSPLGFKEKLSEPYEVLFAQMQMEEMMERLIRSMDKKGGVAQEYTDGMMQVLRLKDEVLSREQKGRVIPEEAKLRFHQSVEKYLQALEVEEDKVVREMMLNERVFKFLVRQPERVDEILQIPKEVPDLFALMEEGGPLASNKDKVWRDVFENGEVLMRARQIEKIFSRKQPIWRLLYMYTEWRIGDKLAAAGSEYPVDKIGETKIEDLVARHKQVKEEGGEKSRLERIVKEPGVVEGLVSGEMDRIPIRAMNGIYKKLVFRDYLRMTVERSRSQVFKQETDVRNRKLAAERLGLEVGDYIHASPVEATENVLLSGNLPREALGETADTDSYPFHTDFTKMTADHLESYDEIREVLLGSLSGGYGDGGLFGKAGQIFYVYKRSPKSYEGEVSYGPRKHQDLIWGGMPATEISGVVVRSEQTGLSKVKEAVVENGFYVPIYNIEGELLFTGEQYDQIREKYNLEVEIEVWDNSMRVGDKKGSNPGGTYMAPTEEGPEEFYVKFEKEDSKHMWVEQLADNLYQEMGVKVPDTEIVKVEGSYGHASRILETEEVSREEIVQSENWNEGFVVDAWLANWDIPYAPERNAMMTQEGGVYRLDNGGALLFHAKGKRKSEKLFSKEVKEIEEGSDRSRLGEGMRQEYPGVSDGQVSQQIDKLVEVMTDNKIEQLVNSIRLVEEDREFLKERLKARRDYLAEYAESL